MEIIAAGESQVRSKAKVMLIVLFDYEMLRTMNVFHKIVFVTGVPVYRC
jgi:hypothetical protein